MAKPAESRTSSRTLNVFIACKPDVITGFVSNPLNLPLWAKAFCKSVIRKEDNWFLETPQGQIKICFTRANAYGILDHYLTLPSGQEVYAPMHAITNGAGTEVVFTLLRLPGVSEEQFDNDAAMVERDLRTLKSFMENKA